MLNKVLPFFMLQILENTDFLLSKSSQ